MSGWWILLTVAGIWLGVCVLAVIGWWAWMSIAEPDPPSAEPDWSRPHGNVTVIRSGDPYNYPPRGGR